MEKLEHYGISTIIEALYRLISKKSKIFLLFSIFFALTSSSLEVATIATTLTFLENIRKTAEYLNGTANLSVINDSTGRIFRSGLWLIFVVNSSAIVRIFTLWFNDKVSAQIANSLLADMYYGFMTREFKVLRKINTATILTSLTTYHVELVYTISNCIALVTSIMTVAGIIITLLIITPRLTVATLLIVGSVYGAIMIGVRNKVKSNSLKISESAKLQITHIQETFGDVKNIILGNHEQERTNEFKDLDMNTRVLKIENSLIGSIPRFTIESLGITIITIFCFVVINDTANAKSILSVVGAFAVGVLRLLPYVQTVYSRFIDLKVNKTGTEKALSQIPVGREFSVLTAKEKNSRRTKEDFEFKRLDLEKICFRHEDDNSYLYKDITINIAALSSMGIVGKSGSGKTTFLDIAMTLIKPTSGRVLVNGFDIWEKAEARKLYRRNIHYISQSLYFPNRTFGELITGMRISSQWDYEKLRYCAFMTGLEDSLSKVNGGYERKLGENACMLSGGERQRLSIAKALYRQFPIIMLDEPTSALDSMTEEIVLNAIKTLRSFSTLIIVSHRKGPLDLCDSVYDVTKCSLVRVGK